MVATPKYMLVEERLGEPLIDRLLFWRDVGGVSYNAMARMLQAQTHVRLTGQTVRDWLVRIDEAAA